MKVFADTGAWFAAFDRRDAFHDVARSAILSIQGQRGLFLTSDYIVDEAITAILTRAGHRFAVAFGDWVQNERTVKVVKIDDDLWQAAWRLFKRYDDKEFSFTDCTSFAIMQRHGLIDAFSFDHHYEQAGFRLWPRRQ
jgi:predicted nucleic acid-binding protein